jgi:hypothetical protein
MKNGRANGAALLTKEGSLCAAAGTPLVSAEDAVTLAARFRDETDITGTTIGGEKWMFLRHNPEDKTTYFKKGPLSCCVAASNTLFVVGFAGDGINPADLNEDTEKCRDVLATTGY